MAISRNARRKLAQVRKAERQTRNGKRAMAQRNQEVRDIVARNLSGPRPERSALGLTQDYSSFESGSVSPKKHCEAKQLVTVYGKDIRCIPKR